MNMKDDWVAAALSNDTLVAELLSRLTQSSSHPPHPFLRLPCVWGHRQRRSKPRKESAAVTGTRRSPTTPLSWSGASDGDYSNNSRPPSDLSRSNKGAYGDDVTDNISSSSTKKKKKKRSFAEEESVLLKERVGLKRDLASMNLTLNRQRVRSQSLNRMKLDLCCTATASSCREAPSCPRQTGEIKGSFALPDLNMMPSEEEEMVSGMTLETGCAFTYSHAMDPARLE